MQNNNVILCIDHDVLLLEVFSLMLIRDGYNVVKAVNITEAAAAIQRQQPALILLDLDLGELVVRLRDIAPVIIMSVAEFDDRAQAAVNAGASGFIFKPALNLQKLKEIIADHVPQKVVG